MLSMGMITAARPGIDAHDSIDRLRHGGFDGVLHLFCEPSAPPVRPLPRVIVHRNTIQRGVLGNWAYWLIAERREEAKRE
jgi:hypothetical protein